MQMRFRGDRLLATLLVSASLLLFVAISRPERVLIIDILSDERPEIVSEHGLLRPNATSPVQVEGWDAPKVFRQIDSAFGQFRPGTTLFKSPEVMTVGNTERVIARIGLEGEDRDILEGLPPGTLTQWKEANITPTMKARLTGEGFDIKPASSEEQVVGGGTFTQWDWLVTPNLSGDRELLLHITAVVSIEGYEKPRDVLVRTQKVRVRVNPKLWVMNFLEANSGHAISFVLGAAFLALWQWAKRKIQSARSKKRAAGFGP